MPPALFPQARPNFLRLILIDAPGKPTQVCSRLMVNCTGKYAG